MQHLLGTSPEEIALRLLTVVTFLATAAIGLHALFHEYRSETGRITKSGIVAAILLGALATISIASELVRANLDSRKEAEASAQEEVRFDEEMAALQNVTRRLSHVSDDLARVSTAAVTLDRGMRNSLQQQNALLNRTDRNLRLSSELSVQARRNTSVVLARIFREANRVRPEDISFSITYRCTPNASGRLPRSIMAENALAVVQISYPPIRSPNFALAFTFVELQTSQQRIEGRFIRNEGAGSLYQQSIFGGFWGNLGPFEMSDEWRDATISVEVAGPLLSSLTIDDLRDIEEPVHCEPRMEFFLHGRRIAEAEGTLEHGGGLNYRTTFPLVRVTASRLPRP